MRRGFGQAIGRFPGQEAAVGGGEGTGAGVQAIGDDQQAVVGEQAGDGEFVGLQLLEGGTNGGVFVGGVFEFDDDQGQAVDEQHHVGAFVDAVFDDGELVDGQVVVVFGLGEVHQPDQVAAFLAVVVGGDGDAFGEQAVEGFVVGDEAGGIEALDLAQGIQAGLGRDGGVEAGDGGFDAGEQQHVFVAGPFWQAAIGGDVGAVEVAVAFGFQALKGQVFDGVFAEFGHVGSHRFDKS